MATSAINGLNKKIAQRGMSPPMDCERYQLTKVVARMPRMATAKATSRARYLKREALRAPEIFSQSGERGASQRQANRRENKARRRRLNKAAKPRLSTSKAATASHSNSSRSVRPVTVTAMIEAMAADAM